MASLAPQPAVDPTKKKSLDPNAPAPAMDMGGATAVGDPPPLMPAQAVGDPPGMRQPQGPQPALDLKPPGWQRGPVGAGDMAGGGTTTPPPGGGGMFGDPPPPQPPAAPPTTPIAPLATPHGGTGPAPAQPAAAPAGGGADPFAASGGGTYFAATGQWVPNNNPAALQAAQAANGGAAGTGGAPGTPTGEGQAGGGINAPGGIVTAPPVGGDTPGPRQPQGPQPAETVPPAGAQPQTMDSAYKGALMKMLSDNQQAPSVEDPALKGQADAFHLAQTREGEAARSAMAERMAQDGGAGVNSGAFNNELAGMYQRQGEAEGGFNAGLVGKELQDRRNQLMQVATLAGNQLSGEQQRDLQKQLGELDAQIRRETLTQQGSQFGQSLAEQARQANQSSANQVLGINSQSALGQGDLALRNKLGSGQLNLGLLSALMQNSQAGNALGAQLGMFNSGQNQQALMQMLGLL